MQRAEKYLNMRKDIKPATKPLWTTLIVNIIFMLAEPGSAWLIAKICWYFYSSSVCARGFVLTLYTNHWLVDPCQLLYEFLMKL